MDKNFQLETHIRAIENEVIQPSLKNNQLKGPSLKNWVLFFVLLGLTLFTTYLAGGKLYALSLFLILGAA